MSADFQGLATKGLKGLKVAGWYTMTLALNMLRRGLILARYTLACWQKQKVNRAMRRLGEQFFQALEQGETNPLVVSDVSDAVQKAKDLKEVKDKNYQAIAAIREKIRAAWIKESPPVPAPAPEPPPAPAEPTEATEKPEEPAAPRVFLREFLVNQGVSRRPWPPLIPHTRRGGFETRPFLWPRTDSVTPTKSIQGDGRGVFPQGAPGPPLKHPGQVLFTPPRTPPGCPGVFPGRGAGPRPPPPGFPGPPWGCRAG